METQTLQSETSIFSTKIESSSSEQLKSILLSLTEQQTSMKSLITTVRTVLKDVDRQSKEFDKLKNKKSRVRAERKVSDTPSGITKPVSISDELARFLGVEIGTLVPRNEVTKGVSSYVRKFELSDPTNKQKFILTDKPEGTALFNLLGCPTEEVTYFNLQRYLKGHYTGVKTDAKSANTANTITIKAEVVPATPVVNAPAIPATHVPEADKEKVLKKKTVMVKKRKEATAELTED